MFEIIRGITQIKKQNKKASSSMGEQRPYKPKVTGSTPVSPTMMSKQKGNIAVSSVILVLQKSGFNVFSEIGDFSKVDLIAEKNNILKKIQVKYCGQRKIGKEGYYIYLDLRRKAQRWYKSTDIDWFACYHPITEQIAWVKVLEAQQRNTVFLRVNTPKNNQKKKVKFIEDYSISNFIQDFYK